MVERRSCLFLQPEIECWMIREVSTDTGSVENDWDVMLRKVRSWSDSRKH
jgi:hypothetical protein